MATVVTVTVVAFLYWARPVIIPFALAIFLAFLCNPLVMLFHRWGLRRVPAVLAVTTLAGVLLAAVGWMVGGQLGSLLNQLPEYTGNMQAKVKSLREASAGGGMQRFAQMVDDLEATWKTGDKNKTAVPKQDPLPVVMQSDEPFWLHWIPTYAGSLLEFFSQAALVVVLALFMLLAREDLRNRFIRLFGRGHMTVTTKAVDDAGQRISRFLVTQLFINGGVGAAFGIGLWLIGVDYAPLWGFLVFLLRYVPYVGAPIAALFPLALSLIMFEAWWPALMVLALYLALELAAANVLEPWLFGHSIGVSAVALLMAAAFWAFLWGPIGLVLSCPLTVCLVVLGKYVPRLEFLAILLGDRPALEENATFYQRLSAHDEVEARQILMKRIQAHERESVFDDLWLPALSSARLDRRRGGMDEQDERQFLETAQATLGDTSLPEEGAANNTLGGKRVRILAVPVNDELDKLALEMLRKMLDPLKWEVLVTGTDLLSTDVVARVAEEQPEILCLGTVLPGGLTRVRYLCKRLKQQCPRLQIVVGLFGPGAAARRVEHRLHDAGADRIETALAGLCRYLRGWRPALQASTELNGHADRHADCEMNPASPVASLSPARSTAMADTREKIKGAIDKAADKAKDLTDKATDKAKDAASAVGQKMKDMGQKVKDQGK
jgi:predicted PurR-regulated permease PerM